MAERKKTRIVMANPYNEGFKPILDHLDVKNRESVSDWEERLWQRQRRMDFVDPRDESGRKFFRKYVAKVSDLRSTAKRLQANARK
ncbi:MAG: hypothetical protein KJO76_02865 [Gammaproteobacteria bacterium]|nr:hypothetical protein [Gammaproteobacteria bacterium]